MFYMRIEKLPKSETEIGREPEDLPLVIVKSLVGMMRKVLVWK